MTKWFLSKWKYNFRQTVKLEIAQGCSNGIKTIKKHKHVKMVKRKERQKKHTM